MARRHGYDNRTAVQAAPDESQHPCSRQPKELCDGARLVVQPDGISHRVPALTPRAFCTPCRSRIIACLEELPSAYRRLSARIGEPVKAGKAVRVMPGSRVLVSPDVDALMREMAAIVAGWSARVQHVPGLELSDPGLNPDSAEGVEDACLRVLAKHPDPLLALQPKWMSRTFTYQPAATKVRWVTDCKRCRRLISPGRPPKPGDQPRWYLAELGTSSGCEHQPADSRRPERPEWIPDHLRDMFADEEVIYAGDGWLTVQQELGGAEAGNEIIDLHWKARRVLGEVKARPESFDGIPCRTCEVMALERAEPPSDPNLAANHSKCPECGDEMDRETFTQWADTYAQWAKSAGIRACKRCSLDNHGECSWIGCRCVEADHPRRQAAA